MFRLQSLLYLDHVTRNKMHTIDSTQKVPISLSSAEEEETFSNYSPKISVSQLTDTTVDLPSCVINQQETTQTPILEASQLSLDTSVCGSTTSEPIAPLDASFPPLKSETVEQEHDVSDDLPTETIDEHDSIQDVITPPTPRKFPPRRLLEKARSSSNNETSIGKRTSRLLRKFSIQTLSSLSSVSHLKHIAPDTLPDPSKKQDKRKTLAKRLKETFSKQTK